MNDALAKEIDRLRTENELLTEDIQLVYDDLVKYRNQVRRLIDVLKPFADEAIGLSDDQDELPIDYMNGDCSNLTKGHLRAAAAALKETGDE